MSTHVTRTTIRLKKRDAKHTSRRGGFVVVYVAAGLFAFLGAAALAVDLGRQYSMKSEAQNAADAAALAGAKQLKQTKLPDGTLQLLPGSVDAARAEAIRYARINGYDMDKGAQVDVQDTPSDEDNVKHPEWLRVTLNRPEPLIFMRFFGQPVSRVAATATALHIETKVTNSKAAIGGLGTYGVSGGPVNLSVFGPNGLYNFGDPYDTLLRPTADGTGYEDNVTTPEHPGGYDPPPAGQQPRPKGIDFDLDISPSFPAGQNVEVEIFDPDTYNADGNPDSLQGVRIDELRAGQDKSGPTPITDVTTTKFTLLSDNGTPNDRTDDKEVDTQTFGDDSATDMAWNKVFSFPRSPDPKVNYRVNVQTTGGASENGFDLRASPDHPEALTDDEWSQTYGSQRPDQTPVVDMSSRGRMPINFNASGQVTFGLGEVPAGATKVIIWKFDTDVGGQDIQYQTPNGYVLPNGQQPVGQLAGNGMWVKDEFTLDENYRGGNWTATYNAAPQDTSSWQMSYEGPPAETADTKKDVLRLIR